MKRIIVVLLALVLCISAMSVTAFAASDATLSVNHKTAKRGEEVTLTVSVDQNVEPGIAGIFFKVSYDKDVLEKVSFTAAGFGGTFTAIDGYDNFTWDNGVNTTNTGAIAYLTFKVKDNAPAGRSDVTVTADVADFDATYFETLAPVGSVTVNVPHVCDPIDVDEVPATCTSTGVKAHQECDCGKLYLNGVEVTADDLVIPMLKHKYTTYTEVEAPTCQKVGKETATCDYGCGTTDTRDIPMLDHDWSEWETVAADANKHVCYDRKQTRHCSVGNHDEERILKGEGHKWVLQEEGTVKPTKDKDGNKHYKCSVCGVTKDEVWKYSKVPSTGDITPVLYLGGFGAFAMIAAAAYVLKRKFAR